LEIRPPKTKRSGVTLRAILVGLLLIPINSYWIFMSEIIRYQGHPTTISLFYSCIFSLVVLILLNGLLRRYIPRWVFSQSELITIYVMLNIGAALVGHDSIQILVSLMPYAAYFKTPENNWGPLFADRLPDWLVIKDPIAVKNFYRGGHPFLMPENFTAWIVPVLMWSSFIIVLGVMFLCMNVLLRKQWTEREKLSYPLVQLPLDMTVEGAPLFKERLLWYGLAIAAAIDIINGLATLYPSIPMIPIKTGALEHMEVHFAGRPWNNIGWLPTLFYPFGIGLGMLLPVDLLFSCWFFFWFWKAELILTAALGLETIRNMPFVYEQSFGAYMGICVFAIMVSRRHFIDLIKHFLGHKTDIDDAGEPIRYRTAMWIILLGAVFLSIFSRAAGLSPWLIPPFFLIFFAMSIAVTRMRAELGPPAHDLHNGGPDRIITSILGPRQLTTESQSVFSMFYWFNRAYRSHQMPFQLEGFKMAERTQTSYRGLYLAILIATIFGTFVAFGVILHLLYQHGAASASLGPPNVPMIFGSEPWNRMNTWVKNPASPDTNTAIAIVVGFGVTILLNSLRMNMSWFPFHPVGFAVSCSWSMHRLWLAMFIAWAIKLVMLRYGGLKLYRRALPFFLGIILGECIVGSFWTIWGIIFNLPSYAFWP
jgi:hypothetical protein